MSELAFKKQINFDREISNTQHGKKLSSSAQHNCSIYVSFEKCHFKQSSQVKGMFASCSLKCMQFYLKKNNY